MDGEKLERRKKDFWESERDTGKRVWKYRTSHEVWNYVEYL